MSQIDLQWFADEGEKTEEPSETRLRKAREEGRVAKSQELNGSIVFLLVTVVLVLMAPWMFNKICEMLIFYFSNVMEDDVANAKFFAVFVRYLLMLVLPLAVTGAVAGVASNFIQNGGWISTTKPITPSFSKIVPKFGEYFKKNFFSMLGVFNIFKSIIKVAVISIVAFFFIRNDLNTTLGFLHTAGPEAAMRQVSRMVAKLLIVSAVILIVISIFDYVMQRREFRQKMKMTKQEVKEEFKENEGDPEVKSRLDQAQRQLLMQNMPKAVKEADVLITNPTHFAVALQWKRNETSAPKVTAKGEDQTALTMRKIAKENDVPVIEDRPLARGLYASTEIGSVVPEEYWRAISIVYTQIGYMNQNHEYTK